MRVLVRLMATLALVVTASPAAGQAPGSVPPPTPVPPEGSPSPYPTTLETPPPSAEEPRIPATSSALMELDARRVLFEDRADVPLPIASLTKIMTALLVLERAQPSEAVTVSELAAGQPGAELGLEPGERLSVRDLLLALLLQSANDAAVALAEHVGGTVEGFVAEMNARAAQLGMRNTEFFSPSGLDDRGRSTALDLATLSAEAFANPAFAEIVATKFHRIPAPEKEKREIQNRNALLWLYPGAIGGKTGYTAAAGFCLVAAAEQDGLRLVSVVLGTPAQAFDAGAELLNHGFAAWERRTVVTLGQTFEPVPVEGETVLVEADATLQVLIERGAPVDSEVAIDPGLTLPVEDGDAVGSVTALVAGQPAGEVGLVAVEDVGAPDDVEADLLTEDEAAWFERAWEAIAGLSVRVFEALGG